MNKKKLLGLVIGILITILGIAIYYTTALVPTKTISSRPIHCISDVCIDEKVFKDLPEYPNNFNEVWDLFYPESKIGLPVNFSIRYPDENYWKQPEFYAKDFAEQGLQYYTINKMLWGLGSGAYPGDIAVSNITEGDIFPVVTYWHSGWSIPNYQLFKLTPTFPTNGTMRMGEIRVEQDPEKATQCFDINITPKNIMLEPTSPKFFKGWAEKITAEITAKCKGDWLIQFKVTEADEDVQKEAIYTHGISDLVFKSVQGGLWQVFVQVQ